MIDILKPLYGNKFRLLCHIKNSRNDVLYFTWDEKHYDFHVYPTRITVIIHDGDTVTPIKIPAVETLSYHLALSQYLDR